MPGAVQNGSAIWLNCAYETDELDSLYSVKWYRYNVGKIITPPHVSRVCNTNLITHSHTAEFYRYLENDYGKAEKKFYPQAGLYVDVS